MGVFFRPRLYALQRQSNLRSGSFTLQKDLKIRHAVIRMHSPGATCGSSSPELRTCFWYIPPVIHAWIG